MRNETFHRPDEDAMWRLLNDNPRELATVVLHLAWCEGLQRSEIWELRWDQVDYDAKRLHLPDRDVPLEDMTAAALRNWRSLLGAKRDVTYVASSMQTRKRVTEQHISRVARLALDSADMKDVRLVDLRHDFVRRQMEQYDWRYVIRISGLSVTTYRTQFVGQRNHGLPTAPPEQTGEDKTEQLWQLLQENRSGPAGIGLWLSQQANLTQKVIVSLTWDQVDLDRGILHLESGDVYMIKEVIQILKEEKARRGPDDDPHVILTPNSRKPMDVARLSTLMRNLLVHNGMEDYYTDTLRYATRIQRERERILRQAKDNGSITRREVEQLLGVKSTVAYTRLSDLVESGDLVGTSKGYFPAESVVPKERWREAVLEMAAKKDTVTVKDVADLLHTGKYSANRLLRRMAAAGELVTVREDKTYLLP